MEIITKEQFEEKVLKNQKKVILDFFANWCGPCKMLMPVLEQIEEERDDVEILKVNIDQDEELAKQFGVLSIPTLVYFNGGEEKDKTVGYRQKSQIIEVLDNLK